MLGMITGRRLSAASQLTLAAMCVLSPVTLPVLLQWLIARAEIEVTHPPPDGHTLLDSHDSLTLPNCAAAASLTGVAAATLHGRSKCRMQTYMYRTRFKGRAISYCQ
jgi:hypothetical protein